MFFKKVPLPILLGGELLTGKTHSKLHKAISEGGEECKAWVWHILQKVSGRELGYKENQIDSHSGPVMES